jgi:ketosteroid isomerase-like protein
MAMPGDDVAIIKRVYVAFAARDPQALEALCADDAVVHNSVTGSAQGKERYEGRGALSRFLADIDRIWTRLELRPQTFHSTRPGSVLVAGTVFAERGGHAEELSAAWSWKVVESKVTYVRVLPTAEAYRMLAATSG